MKITLLLYLVVLFAIGCSDSSAPPANTQTYSGPIMPLEVGNMWAYHLKSYPGTGRVDESEDTMTIISKTTFNGKDGYVISQKSMGSNEFIYFNYNDSLCYGAAGGPEYVVLAVYPMVEGQQTIITDESQQPGTIVTIKLDSLKTNLDLGFEKFYALKYRRIIDRGTDTVVAIDYYEPGIGWLKEEFYNSSGKLSSSFELAGYHVKK